MVIDAGRKSGRISKNLYGHFSEHLGRCIYEGFWVGEDSPVPNTEGIRNDVVEALKAIRIPVLRWPGGYFADDYRWKDGVGPRENRPYMINTHCVPPGRYVAVQAAAGFGCRIDVGVKMWRASGMEITGCKGCSVTVTVSEEEMVALQRLALQDKELATEEKYARRVGLCGSCPALQFGTTCRYCGCLVRIKAKLRDSRCPSPNGGRW